MTGGTKCRKCQVTLVTKQTTAVKLVFFMVLQLVIKRFSTVIMVDPQLLLAALPTAIAYQMQGATTIEDIFKEDGPLDRALNWCNFGILAKIVSKFGDQKCKQELNSYVTILGQYIKSRSKVVSDRNPEDPQDPPTEDTTPNEKTGTDVAAVSSEARDVEIVVDAEWEEALLQNEATREYIAALLGTSPNRLLISHIQ